MVKGCEVSRLPKRSMTSFAMTAAERAHMRLAWRDAVPSGALRGLRTDPGSFHDSPPATEPTRSAQAFRWVPSRPLWWLARSEAVRRVRIARVRAGARVALAPRRAAPAWPLEYRLDCHGLHILFDAVIPEENVASVHSELASRCGAQRRRLHSPAGPRVLGCMVGRPDSTDVPATAVALELRQTCGIAMAQRLQHGVARRGPPRLWATYGAAGARFARSAKTRSPSSTTACSA